MVYLARDPRLDRDVAIKVLPEHLAADADRLGRFQREAKVLASLNHTSIAAIYGSEEFGGKQYLVLEYVKGSSLDAHLERGPLPLDEAMLVARQIAEALEAATRMASFTVTSSRRISLSVLTARSRCSISGWPVRWNSPPPLTPARTAPIRPPNYGPPPCRAPRWQASSWARRGT